MNQGPIDLQSIALPLSYTPTIINVPNFLRLYIQVILKFQFHKYNQQFYELFLCSVGYVVNELQKKKDFETEDLESFWVIFLLRCTCTAQS